MKNPHTAFWARWWDGSQEIFETLGRNRLRTLLTGLSIAWGIFMLVLLLAAGKGLERGTQYNFRDDAVNSIWVRPGRTSLPYAGNAVGRSVQLTNADWEALKRQVDGIEHISGRYYAGGELSVSHGDQHAHFDVRGTHPDHRYIEKTLIRSGRFLNELDLENRRKVAVIGSTVERFLFEKQPALGHTIRIGKAEYQVVGTFDDVGGERELNKIYIPLSTAQLVHGGYDRLHHIMFTTGNAGVAESETMAERTHEILARRHAFSSKDTRALSVRNNLERYHKLMQVFSWVNVFVWLVGAGTLIAGIVGVSNIMLISVAERTVEIGVRKAVGATPSSIITLILAEAILVTSVFGYLGLVSGVAAVELVRTYVPENDYFRDPEIDLTVALVATGALVIAGTLAGFFPARRAAKVNPVAVLRTE